MRTHLEFVSAEFPPEPSEDEEVNPGRYGKRLAAFLAEKLPQHGFKLSSVYAEDWGWCIAIESTAFPLWIGCGNYDEYENGFLCFIEPSKPFVRRWLSKVSTADTVDRLATAMQAVLEESGKVRQLRWWTDEEARAHGG
jgi:hypothetical protein